MYSVKSPVPGTAPGESGAPWRCTRPWPGRRGSGWRDVATPRSEKIFITWREITYAWFAVLRSRSANFMPTQDWFTLTLWNSSPSAATRRLWEKKPPTANRSVNRRSSWARSRLESSQKVSTRTNRLPDLTIVSSLLSKEAKRLIYMSWQYLFKRLIVWQNTVHVLSSD